MASVPIASTSTGDGAILNLSSGQTNGPKVKALLAYKPGLAPQSVSKAVAEELQTLVCHLTRVDTSEPSTTAIRLRSLRHTIKENKALFRRKRHALRQLRNHYEDDDFPTNRSALYLQTDMPDPAYDRMIHEWRALEDIQFDGLPRKPQTTHPNSLSESVTSDSNRSVSALSLLASKKQLCVRAAETGVHEFRQGQIGNCWMVTALASLVWHHSHYLCNVIPDPRFSREGIYQVFFCLNGRWQPIEVDDRFPCDSNGRLVFAQALGFQVYAPLLEKALAKYHSCYKALNAGTVLEGFSTLTGMPMERKVIRPKETASLWRAMRDSLSNHHMMVGCCGRGVMGLFASHAYTVLDVMSSVNIQALLLWNPWGKQSLTGSLRHYHDWLAAKLPHFQLCPGMFWMRFIDFCFTFDYVDICKFSSRWYCKRYEFTLPFSANDQRNFTVFVLSVGKQTTGALVGATQETNFEFTVYQEVYRNIKLVYQLDLNVLVFRLLPDETLEYSGSSRVMVNKISSYHKALLPGRYLVAVISFNHWGPTSRLKEAPKLTMAFHASNPFKVEPLQANPNLLGDMIIEVALNIGEVRRAAETPEECCFWTEYTIRTSFCSYIVVVENRHQSQHLIASVNTGRSHHSVSLRSSQLVINVVPPGTRQILVILSSESDKQLSQYDVRCEISLESDHQTYKLEQVFVHRDVRLLASLFAPRWIEVEGLAEQRRQAIGPHNDRQSTVVDASDVDLDEETDDREPQSTITTTHEECCDVSESVSNRTKGGPSCCCCSCVIH